MTSEEAREWLRSIKDSYIHGGDEAFDNARREALDMAIKALKQEPILDKIRAEINDVVFDWQEIDGEHESFKVVDLNDAINIIDKYKSEEKCPCYNCENFETKGWSHCKIHENAYGDVRCDDYHKTESEDKKWWLE